MKKDDTITLPREVVEQTLEALGQNEWGTAYHDFHVTTALRAALDQPQVEQEPVAWMWNDEWGYSTIQSVRPNHEATPLYTRQQPRQPLTDEQISRAVRPLYSSDKAAAMGLPDDVCTARAIERTHGIWGEA